MSGSIIAKTRRHYAAAVLSLCLVFNVTSFAPESSLAGGNPTEFALPIAAPGETLTITQGSNEPVGPPFYYDHTVNSKGQYAFDFALGNKAFVIASAADGRIIGINDSSDWVCSAANVQSFPEQRSAPGCWAHSNFILVANGDGTASLYMHLKQGSTCSSADSFCLHEGDTVRKGQPLARAGSTGWSTGPHLHFQVEAMPPPNTDPYTGWWWTQSVAVPGGFTDPAVRAEAPDGIPKTGQQIALPTKPQSEAPLATSTDWPNATYQSTCANQVKTERSVTLIPGQKASTPNPEGSGPNATLDFVLAAQAVGDITGDGRPEVAVGLWCHQSDTSPNFIVWEIQVFTDGPTRLGVIVPTPDAGYGTVHFDDPGAFSIVDQKLVAGVNLYGPGSCGACGNPVTGTYSWSWDGKQFVRAGADQAGHPPDTDIPATDLNGEVHGFLRAVDVGKSQITIDKVDWFADAAAAQACQEDGVSTDLYIDGWCTTHYYRNVNPMTRDVAVSPDALIILLSTDSPSDLPQASERVKAPQSDDPWEINVENGLVTTIHEVSYS